MLYLDSSALVKGYIQEKGSNFVRNLLNKEEELFTSILSYAEVLAAFRKKYRAKGIGEAAYSKARDRFILDWVLRVNALQMDTGTMTAVPELVEQFPLKGADAVQLSAALWLRDMSRMVWYEREDRKVEFWVSDQNLVRYARQCNLDVYDPENL